MFALGGIGSKVRDVRQCSRGECRKGLRMCQALAAPLLQLV